MGHKTQYPVHRENSRVWYENWSAHFVPDNGLQPPHCASPVTLNGSSTRRATDFVDLGESPSDWRRLLEAGSGATSGLSGVRHEFGGYGGSYSYQGSGPLACLRGDSGGDLGFTQVVFPAPDFVPLSGALAKAASRALDKYLTAVNTWRGGNFLAEFRETVHMLRHPIQGLFGHTFRFATAVGDLKRFATSPKRYAKALGNLWLAYVFGWKPFFDDIRGVNEAIQKLANGTGHDSFRIVASATDKIWSDQGANGCTTHVNNYHNYRRYKVKVSRVRYVYSFRSRPESFATVRDTFGLTGHDILPAVWEAIPWSFFIDYFLNVQEVLDSLRYAESGWAWGESGIRNTLENRCSDWYQVSFPANISVQGSVGGVVAQTICVGRSALGGPVYPNFRFRIPGMGSLKWVNTGALAAQIFRSKPR